MPDTLTRALGSPSTLSREARTVEAVALSGPAPAVRPAPAPDGSRTAWVEELDAQGADLSRFIGGPALVDHTNRVDAAVGRVETARIEGDKILAQVRFDTSPGADSLMGKLEAGSVRGVSLGYIVQTWERAGTRDGLPVFCAVAWTPHEISFTPLPVDSGALVRSKDHPMPNTTPAADAVPVDDTAPEDRLGKLEALVAKLAETVEALAKPKDDKPAAPATGARSIVLNNRPSVVQGASYDDPAVMRRGMADALAASFSPLVQAEGHATMYRSWRPSDMAAALLSARGETVNRFDREALLVRALGAHGTSDFPGLLADAANKALLAQYQAAAPTYRQIAARKAFQDFKAHRFLRVGDFPTFHEVIEGGETRYGTLSENNEAVTAREFASGIVIGRKALINDDLSALSDFSGLIATRAAAFEDATVYALLADNGPTLADGKALFDAAHGNKAGTGAALSVTTLSAAVAALRGMTGLDGLPLNVQPRFLVVGVAAEVAARQVVATITPAKSTDVNPWGGAFEVIVSPHIAGNRWFLAADPAQVPSVVYGWVGGAEGPQISVETDFDTRAVKVRAGIDFGAGAIDFRGLYLNAGA
ncbi:phage major capsid protein [Pararhodospirillum oryzae]|uniref:Bacteriophage Mu GpT domain-containing protein n=1 Tax=Pararhodospirillum oryzae TaxID=478448 RepID=A0A512H690_9PROT|nr:Mu-like prophage major head subunit gpT family protein [Pararhodospirillum oryzae]GEO80963.1 hypothetical protein ROR02_10940 [Pararhodospirillum oryzae]